jgi:ABC-type transporter Mla subunit MlaD
MKNKFIYIFLLGTIGCSYSENYKVQFEDSEELTIGTNVFINEFVVGHVKDLSKVDESKILATISVKRNFKLTNGSTFTIHTDLLGTKYILIEIADGVEPMSSEVIYMGHIQPLDTTGFSNADTRGKRQIPSRRYCNDYSKK